MAHLLDIVSGRRAVDSSTSSDRCPHRHGIPDRVGGEEGDGIARLHSIVLYESCAQLSRLLLDAEEVQFLLGDGIDIAADVLRAGVLRWRVLRRLKCPFPCRQLGGDCTLSATLSLFCSGND